MEATTLSTHSLSADLAQATKLLDAIEDRLAFVVDPDDLGDAVCDAVQLSNRVTALTGRLAVAATNNMTVANAGQRTVGQYVAARTNSRGVHINRVPGR